VFNLLAGSFTIVPKSQPINIKMFTPAKKKLKCLQAKAKADAIGSTITILESPTPNEVKSYILFNFLSFTSVAY
jgi:hypothetical protein